MLESATMSKDSLALAIIDQAVRDFLRGDGKDFYSAKQFLEERNLFPYAEKKRKKPIQRHALIVRGDGLPEVRVETETFGEFKRAAKMMRDMFGYSAVHKVPMDGFWYSANETAKDELRRA